MKNKELFWKMQYELKGYQLGLHNIGVEKYKSLMCSGYKFKCNFEITGAVVSEKAIAEHVLKSGLNIVERCCGLKSTVKPIFELKEDSLNYTYNLWGIGKVYNVIVAVPYFLHYNGEEYFIGDMNDWTNICNLLMFNPVIFKEFIYGYYVKDIVDSIEMKDERNRWHEFVYDEKLDFYENPYFYGKLKENEQIEFLRKLFKEKRRLLTNLKLANNNSFFPLLFRTSYERMIIKCTREQAKRMIYEKKKK